jgi:hypothetical protein
MSVSTIVVFRHKKNNNLNAAWFTEDWFKQICCFQVPLIIHCWVGNAGGQVSAHTCRGSDLT